MPFDPLKVRPCLELLPFLSFREDVFDQVLVLHRFPRRRPPSIFPPVDVPIRNAVDGIFTVRDNAGVSITRNDFQSSQDRS